MEGNTKKKLKKEYVPLLVAILVLIVLVLAMIIVLFYKDDKGLKVPDLPDKEAVDVGVFNFDSGKYDPDELDVDNTKKVGVKYEVITDYYKKGVILSSPVVNYDQDEFILRSSFYSTDPFVSVIDMKGKLKWMSKLNVKGYENIKVMDVFKDDGNYYVFGFGVNENKKDNMVIKLNSKGNEVDRVILTEKSDNTMREVVKASDGYAIITDGPNNIEIYYFSKDKLLKTPFYLKDSNDNIFKTFTPYVKAASVKDDVVTLVVMYDNPNGKTNFLVHVDLNKKTLKTEEFLELTKLKSPYTGQIASFENSFYTINGMILYQFSSEGKLVNKFDYSTLELGDIKGCNKETFENKECPDSLNLNSVNVNNGYVAVFGGTESDNSLFDVFDKDLKIKNRLIHNDKVHGTDAAIYLTFAYVDGKLYEFYSFGVETPSILVSIIG